MKRLALCVLAVVVLVGTGCGESSKTKGKKKKRSSSSGAQTLSLELTGSGKKPTMKAPSSVEGGLVTITLKNSAKAEGAGQLIRVEGDQTAQDVSKAGTAWGEKGKPLPDWLGLEGGVGATKPGESNTVTQVLRPGRYFVLDIETNAAAPLEVTGQEGSPPTAAPRIEAVDYAFKASGLKAGRQKVLFDNTGKQPHFIVGAPLNPGKTIADVRKAVKDESGPPPFDEKAGFATAVFDGGRRQTVEVDLKKGKYAFLCFVPDRQGGPPHVAKGMISEGVVE